MAFYPQLYNNQNSSQYTYQPYNPNQGYINQQYGFQNQYGNYQQPQVIQPQQQNTQQFQQTQQIPQGINGKIVESIDLVKVSEIPMGGWALFPQADEKCIYLKKYLNDGSTRIITYMPQIEDKAEEPKIDYSNELLEIKNSINVLDEKLSSLIN